ncbi:hypothetical protein HZA39_00200 [Candidatus Peregrinibacteria bacterium]|nr:hypothetical protein [Candidatus Peregrinibacteria bacterium]
MENLDKRTQALVKVADEIDNELRPEANELESKMGSICQTDKPTNMVLWISTQLELSSARISEAKTEKEMKKIIDEAIEDTIGKKPDKITSAPEPHEIIVLKFREKIFAKIPEILKV